MRNRGSQRGSLIRRGDNWAVRFRRHFADDTGNVVYRPTTQVVGPAVGPERLSRTDAQAGADRIVAEANAVSAVPQLQATLRQFVDVRFRPEHIAHLRPAGRSHYEYMLSRHIYPSLGDAKMKDITAGRVQILLSGKAQAGLSKQTVTHVRNVLSAIFRHAKVLGFYRGDLPTEGVRCPGADPRQPRVMTWEQVRFLLDALDPRYRPLVTVVASTGLRIGEALGLRWKFVNLTSDYRVVDGVLIHPNSVAIVQAYGVHGWGAPKTERSRRTVPLPSGAWVALTDLLERLPFSDPDSPVFRGRTGEPLDAHNIARRYLKPAGASIGCPWVHWHCFRHTAATLADLRDADRQKVLGHSSVAMTTHYTAPDLERVRAGLERGTEPKGRVN